MTIADCRSRIADQLKIASAYARRVSLRATARRRAGAAKLRRRPALAIAGWLVAVGACVSQPTLPEPPPEPPPVDVVELSAADARRSEEHTSELQSPCNLVCRV